MPLSRKGFTLIELLVVISIIALLSTIVMTSVNGQRSRAKDVSFQSTANAVQQSAGICCTGGDATLLNVLGDNICDPASDGTYPTGANLGSVSIDRDCGDVLGFSVRLEPGTSNDGTIDYALCDHDGCEFIPKT
ncbi:MAG: type II secretion system protein [Saccharofermentanales bacterium]